MVDSTALNYIKKYLEELKRYGIFVEKVFLYGSYARGTQNSESDIDLLLVSPIFEGKRIEIISKVWRATEVSDYKIEPVTVSTKCFLEDDVTPIYQIAKYEGIEIPIN